jgi:osmotically-inducible protein OsmY
MRSTEELQLDVLEELAYDPEVDASQIAVTANEAGIVTLKGTVRSYMQARGAERATKRVIGVHGVASDLEVELPDGLTLDDTGIAQSALQAIKWSASVPRDAVKLTVTHGWVTLEGEVDWDFQRRAAHNAVRDLKGVRGVTNEMELKQGAKPAQIREKIEEAFRRNAQLDAQHVSVEVAGHRVTLRGNVPSWSEKDAAERAAFAAPGVTGVDNRIEVRAHLLV